MNELTVIQSSNQGSKTLEGRNIFFDIELFEHAKRIAQMFAGSTLVPEHFRNKIGNCLIALSYAARLGADPYWLMKSMYIVKGNVGVEAKLLIALLNDSGKFTPLQFKYNSDKTECVAYATNKATGEECVGVPATLEMARAEGWDADMRNNKTGGVIKSKWKTMPQLMLMYRSASFFVNSYAPEILFGMKTREELIDISMEDVSSTTTDCSLNDSCSKYLTPSDSIENLNDKIIKAAKEKNELDTDTKTKPPTPKIDAQQKKPENVLKEETKVSKEEEPPMAMPPGETPVTKELTWPQWFKSHPYATMIDALDACEPDKIDDIIKNQIQPMKGKIIGTRFNKILKYAEFKKQNTRAANCDVF